MSGEVDVLHAHVLKTIGPAPDAWCGGYSNQVEAALINAVFSVRARYGKSERTGVRGITARWMEYRGGLADDLRVLARTDVAEVRGITNRSKISGREKAEIVVDAARALVVAGAIHARDVVARQDAARAAYLSVSGCGPVTWSYLGMLLGVDGVKADTWVMRYVRDCLPHVRTSERAIELVSAVAARLGVQARELDHAIWLHQRNVRSARTTLS